jgi:hypothetical protein
MTESNKRRGKPRKMPAARTAQLTTQVEIGPFVRPATYYGL